ncbi:metallophosphoesterase family protein [Paenibacillus xylanexedens]|uniref:metallophosphoesterase family protein n=1 Tax=Paenibacillus xylanexedens TaxID=528191 RepID=UPI0011AA3870|nr:metallophosphoesterase family protein [Paenibacillus xylanexedens]
MKQIQSAYAGDHKSMYILPIGDVHFGNRCHNPKYLDAALRFADKNRARTRIVLMGDLLELATKTSVGRGVYDEAYPTQRQFEIAVEKFKPYADLIDCIIEGNHEERIIRDTSFEIVEEFAHRIGAHDAYARFSGIVNYTLGSGRTYSTYAWHGATGGTTEASVMNAMLKMRETALSHIYLMGHTHKLLNFEREVMLPAPGQEAPIVMNQLFVNTGASLDHGGYGEQKGFPKSLPGYGVIQVYADEHRKTFHKIQDLIS